MSCRNLASTVEVTDWDIFGLSPLPIVCPVCKNKVVTHVNVQCSWKTHLASLIMCCILCPFCFIPYIVDSCKSAKHYCPACKILVAEYRAF